LEALESVAMGELADQTFGELSGGQRQRVLVARALVQDARIVLFDEPFTGLDAPSADLLADLIDRLAAEGRGVLVSTHDVAQTLQWDDVLCLNGRQVAFGPPRTTLTADVLSETYGSALLRVPGLGAGEAFVTADHHGH
jgi:ABC-type Mn2+/Zn2+ transport system ATPase subunit